VSRSSQARLMDGTALANQRLSETTRRTEAFRARSGRRPCLAAFLVGEDPASVTYVKTGSDHVAA
jgi:methylenetetrahydrofolate dehydrogenase (NADP+) / methenyltetrahydrofolate cyclohydrolase